VHIAESRDETSFVARGEGPFADGWRSRGISVAPRAPSSIALLQATGVLATRPLLIHCVQVTSADVALIANAQCTVAHCPASNAKLGHGIAPLAEILESGVQVALGTDSVASSNQMDMIGEARLALLLAHTNGWRHDLDANRGLALATIDGARALGIPSETGSLEVGKSADLAAFRIDATRDEPVYDPATALVFGSGGRRAQLVCVEGKELVREGRLLVSLEADLAAVKSAAERLARFQPTS
jgi:5-methylthioadenosine/S-adenosylhomocysteine deaminase